MSDEGATAPVPAIPSSAELYEREKGLSDQLVELTAALRAARQAERDHRDSLPSQFESLAYSLVPWLGGVIAAGVTLLLSAMAGLWVLVEMAKASSWIRHVDTMDGFLASPGTDALILTGGFVAIVVALSLVGGVVLYASWARSSQLERLLRKIPDSMEAIDREHHEREHQQVLEALAQTTRARIEAQRAEALLDAITNPGSAG